MKPRQAPDPIVLVQEFFHQADSFVIEVDVTGSAVVVTRNDDAAERHAADSPAALAALYARLFAELMERHGGAHEFYTLYNERPKAMDIAAELARLQRRRGQAATLPPRDQSRWHAMRDAAHAAITAADLSSPELVALAKRYYIDLSADGLRNSFTYVIDIDRADACDEPLALGSSKIGGPAHLPADIQWPTDAEYYLYAQLSVAEIKPLDVHDMLPATGTLYYFITEQSRGRLLYSRADATNLRVVRRPATMALPSYMRFLAETEHRLSFRPNWYFDQGTDTYAVPAMINAVPAALRAHLDAIAGNAHGEVCHSKAGDRLFGGEPPDWQSEGDFLREPLLAQFRAFDGNLFVAVDPNDLRAGYTADAQCTYRGT